MIRNLKFSLMVKEGRREERQEGGRRGLYVQTRKAVCTAFARRLPLSTLPSSNTVKVKCR